ncbi:MAG: uracil-DNA glycosylase [Gemmatimonadales bacterium]|nr:MAG: uracil-DNA glycosylase [Gemmatimonadales bacterium]
MTGPARSPVLDHLARWLRQRGELGSPQFVLETMDEAEARALVARVLEEGALEKGRGGVAAPPVPRTPEPAPAPPSRPPPTTSRAPSAEEDSGSGAGPGEPLPQLPSDHEELRTLCLDCTRCGLSETRTQVVFHDGNPGARLMVVGEGPGANEDRTGRPFVGRAGRYLDLLLASVGLTREESVYICNVVKCRPPGNRNPRPEEIEACAPYLRQQIAIVQPEAILAVGTFSAQLLTDSSIPLGRLRGEIHAWEGIPLVVTYHPAALLRNSGWVQPTWEDLQLLRQILDGSDSHGH